MFVFGFTSLLVKKSLSVFIYNSPFQKVECNLSTSTSSFMHGGVWLIQQNQMNFCCPSLAVQLYQKGDPSELI